MAGKDLLGFGKVFPVDKLLNILSKVTGKLYRPIEGNIETQIEAKRIKEIAVASTTAYKQIINETTDLQSFEVIDGKPTIKFVRVLQEKAIDQLPTGSLLERANSREEYQKIKSQMNLENVVGIAASTLLNEEPISDEPVDEDWLTRFFKYAESISSEEMQTLWGRILAGEIREPKSFSLRTLDIIRNLSQDDANIFLELSAFFITHKHRSFILNEYNLHLDNYGFSFDKISKLIEAGILIDGAYLRSSIPKCSVETEFVFDCRNKKLSVTVNPNGEEIEFRIYGLSSAGKELFSLNNVPINEKYLNDFLNYLKPQVKKAIIF
ncbi:DUF2806 domain-containing protein [Siphonobacter sp. SORGH_AS_0500]|uniref:DUF2806 domain-containing protein n=1 Tax=Siphonobacter sp. SORGH_AS_0500 TaxID=1864824 RepID=UPI00285FF846|nr:DUF2806 domain-containing protein [Siphonobacter sp. SORGH_AS_0500]MDR6195610.1 putative repeat protein (TIGR03899 family) [Siphonobacter sp. SORGH_AS_0500]